ncbi:MAG: chorismate mutase [Eubacteriales bacterium]
MNAKPNEAGANELSSLREEINQIDDEICRLFVKRMETSLDIARYKKANGLPVLDPVRERQVLKKVSERVGEEYESYARILYQCMMDLSRTYQHGYMGSESRYGATLNRLLESTPKLFPKRATVACQGCEGAYSQIAAEKLFSAPDIKYRKTFEDVFLSVAAGECEYGILPIENSTAGSVNAIYDLFAKYGANIVRSVRVKVEHSFLALPGAKMEDITEIYSHQQAISQCSEFLKRFPNAKIIPFENTATAARMVASSGDPAKAALSSAHCASLYGLIPLAAGVQNSDGNYTRFICISSVPHIFPGANRTSVMMILPHRPGSLFSVMSKIQAAGVNLIKLESRPIPGSDFGFMFYFDIEESVYSDALPRLLDDLEASVEYFNYLGTYLEQI